MSEKPVPYRDGWLAHKELGLSDEQNPYDAQNPYNEKTQAASYELWQNGYCDRFSNVKHDLVDDLDELDRLMSDGS